MPQEEDREVRSVPTHRTAADAGISHIRPLCQSARNALFHLAYHVNVVTELTPCLLNW